ncbi:hypothetical protein C2W62_18450 [Candidatus Entotheonella serta]|nr:hypothetical protein C2W62_18450 [Candidatus Entotheonella serta]
MQTISKNTCENLYDDQPQKHLWPWACRSIDRLTRYELVTCDQSRPQVGDLAIVEVKSIGQHSRVQTSANERLRLYPGDTLVGVFGHRYATDAFEAEVGSVENLHLLTAAGRIGTVRSRHCNTKSPTRLHFWGYLADPAGYRINLKTLGYHPELPMRPPANVVFVVGTGMNSGKTTTAAALVKALLMQGLRVVACKLTGSVSHRDAFEYMATGAHEV